MSLSVFTGSVHDRGLCRLNYLFLWAVGVEYACGGLSSIVRIEDKPDPFTYSSVSNRKC